MKTMKSTFLMRFFMLWRNEWFNWLKFTIYICCCRIFILMHGVRIFLNRREVETG